jgi:hypothetical protein
MNVRRASVQKINATKARLSVAALVSLAAIASAPLAVSSLGSQGVALPGLNSAQRLMAMLDARSPGEREKGALIKTKNKQRLAFVPRERALGKVFPPKPSPVEQLAKVVAPPPPVEVVPPLVPVIPVAPPALADVISPSSLIASAPLAFGSAIIGGGGGGGGGGGSPPPTSVTPPPTTVTSPVPEPGTWLMMLLGFGMVGSTMSRQRRRTTRAAI